MDGVCLAKPLRSGSGDHVGLGAARTLPDPGQLVGDRDQGSEEGLRVLVESLGLEALEIDA